MTIMANQQARVWSIRSLHEQNVQQRQPQLQSRLRSPFKRATFHDSMYKPYYETKWRIQPLAVVCIGNSVILSGQVGQENKQIPNCIWQKSPASSFALAELASYPFAQINCQAEKLVLREV